MGRVTVAAGGFAVRTPVGRKVAANFHKRGAPLIRISSRDLDRAGVVRAPRMTGTLDGLPALDGGTTANVRTVVWATGYRPAAGWIDGLELPPSGWPETQRGTVPGCPGCTSSACRSSTPHFGPDRRRGRDAEYMVQQLAKRPAGPSVVPAVLEPGDGDGENDGGGEAERSGGRHSGAERGHCSHP
ncbi:hypothetical protein ABIB51_000855 [Arthrobacter sp. UYCu712]